MTAAGDYSAMAAMSAILSITNTGDVAEIRATIPADATGRGGRYAVARRALDAAPILPARPCPIAPAPTPTAKPRRKATRGATLIDLLKAAGCVFCPECFAYQYPDHQTHIPLSVDWRTSRYAAVGGFGNVGMVDTTTGDVVTVTTLPLQASDDVLAVSA